MDAERLATIAVTVLTGIACVVSVMRMMRRQDRKRAAMEAAQQPSMEVDS